VVGHDKRFSSEHFAAAVAEVLATMIKYHSLSWNI